MKLSYSAVALGILLVGAPALAQSGKSEIVGTWLTEDGRAKIKLEKCGETGSLMCGYVAWMKDPLTEKGAPRTDINNPDPAKRTRPSLGLELMENLKAEDTSRYAGEIYNAEDGKKYEVTLTSEDPGELKIKGCLMHFLCQSQTWTRAADLTLPGNVKVVSNVVKGGAMKAVVASGKPHDSQAKALSKD